MKLIVVVIVLLIIMLINFYAKDIKDNSKEINTLKEKTKFLEKEITYLRQMLKTK